MRTTPRPEKVQIVEELKKKIDSANLVVLTDYQGMTVAQLTALRKELSSQGAEFEIIKNTFMAKALALLGTEGVIEHLRGSLGVAFAFEEPVMPAKTIYKYVKEIEKPKVKVGILDKKVFSEDELNRLSKLPSREQLLAKVVGGVASPLYGLVNVLQGNIRKLAYVLEAVRKSKG